MRKLLTALGVLFGATLVAPTAASAAIQSPGLHVTALHAETAFARRGSAEGRYWLVDDDDSSGGGGDDDNSGSDGNGGGNDRDDDDDDRPSRGGGGGGNGGFRSGGFPRGGGGLNGLGNILNGVGRIIQNGQRNQPNQRTYQPSNNYNEQVERQRLQRQMQQKAADDQRRQRSAAEKKNRDQRRKDQQRQETQRLNQERRNNDNHTPSPSTLVPVAPVPANNNDPNPLPPEDNCPDNFQQLRVGATILSPYRTDYPADPRVCAGTTSKGCYLRVTNGPLACGSKPTCVMHCPPNVTVVVPPPKPVVQPVCTTPNCAPLPVAPQPVPVTVPPPPPPPQPVCATPDCSPLQPPPVSCAYPPCGPDPRKEDTTAPEWTIRADPKVEPQPKPTPADKTITADPKIEPQPKPTPADKTVIAEPKTEPQPKPTPADRTVTAQPKTEPKPKPTPADKTVTAEPKTEPQPKPTPPDKTVIAEPKTEPQRKPTPADKTVTAESKTEPDPPKTPPEKTVLADPKTEPKRPTTSPEKTIIAVSLTALDADTPEDAIIPAPKVEPGPKRSDSKPPPNKQTKRDDPPIQNPPSKKDAPPKDPEFGFDDATPVNSPVVPDGKGCTPTGGIPAPRFSIDPNYGKKIYIGALGAIPTVGGPLKGIVDALWKDTSQETLLKEMKDYVDKLVPELLTNERLTKMENRLKDIKDTLDTYNSMDGSEKGSDLLVALGHITTNSSDFLADNGANKAAPDRTLSYFVQFALLKLAVLKERIDKDKQFWPETDPQKYAHDHAEREKQLNDAIRLLVKRVAELRKALIDKRLNKIRIDEGSNFVVRGRAPGRRYEYFTPVDEGCDWHPGSKGGYFTALQAIDQRRKDVERDYGAAVDAILKPILDWKSQLPEEIEKARVEAERARLEAERVRLKNERAQKEFEEFERKQREIRANAKPIEGCSYCEEHGVIGID